ncbi:MAG: Hsp20/alpha crystallin family protein [bacterium]|jgi:HSP20 family protein|nr:Hsp20/alpha crystallin family protein [bacterium]
MRFHHHPWHELRGLRRDLGDLFEELFGSESFDKGESWRPLIDLIESDEEFIVSAELPGMEKKDIKINFHENMLSIRGERKKIATEKSYFRAECFYGPFKRSIKIPGEIAQNKITASYQDGILLVHLPKKHGDKSKDIEINID